MPLTTITLDLLGRYLADKQHNRGPVFVSSNTGMRLTPPGIESIFTKNIGIRPHLLRHACATHMLLNGCNILHIQQLLGHSSVITTQIYTHLNKEDLRKEINAKHPGRLRSVAPEQQMCFNALSSK